MASSKPKKEASSQELAKQVIEFVNLAGLENLLEFGASKIKLKPLERAQDLYFRACEAATAKERISLAQKAIAISPLCADAHTLLGAYEEKGSDRQLELYRTAMDAGRKAIGKEFKKLAGEFWGWLQTRPFMRAKLALAMCLWDRGERAEALTHLRELLELNPNDNQGVRSILAAYLLEERLHDEAAALLKAFEDDTSADLQYCRALLAFQMHGGCANSRKALTAAIEQNKYVPQYLIGKKKLPKTLPAFYSWGDNDEAIFYAARAKKGWDATPGAIEWLSGCMGIEAKPAAKKPAARKKIVAAA